jgi:hypothetical protein
VADVVPVRPPKIAAGASMLRRRTSPPQWRADSRMRTTFVPASPTPDNCREQASVSVQPVTPVNGPEIWKAPSRKLALESNPQHSWYALLASPAVAVPNANSR